jgi:hypothetical protein
MYVPAGSAAVQERVATGPEKSNGTVALRAIAVGAVPVGTSASPVPCDSNESNVPSGCRSPM